MQCSLSFLRIPSEFSIAKFSVTICVEFWLPPLIYLQQDRKREAVEHQRRIQKAMLTKVSKDDDNFESKAIKAMGIMEEGDAVFGSGAEVNLDSQVRSRSIRVHGDSWNGIQQRFFSIMNIFFLLWLTNDDAHAGVLVAWQVSASEAQVLQPGSYGLRVEQVQSDPLRSR